MRNGQHGLRAGGVGRGHIADLLAAQGDFTGDGGDARRGALGDTLDSLGNLAVGGVLGGFLLDIEILSVLADDDQVDGVAAAFAGGGLDGADVGVEVELLAEGDDGRGVAGNLGAGGAAGS